WASFSLSEVDPGNRPGQPGEAAVVHLEEGNRQNLPRALVDRVAVKVGSPVRAVGEVLATSRIDRRAERRSRWDRGEEGPAVVGDVVLRESGEPVPLVAVEEAVHVTQPAPRFEGEGRRRQFR